MQKLIQVSGAIIYRNGKYLLAQRNADDDFGNLWEFPGGSIEADESPEECIVREIHEELGLDVRTIRKLTNFTDEIPSLKILIHLFLCRIVAGEAESLECQNFGWYELKEIEKLDLAPADKKIYHWMLNNKNL